jgi:hypothetical protein
MVMHACSDERWGKPETCVSAAAPCAVADTLSAPQQITRVMHAIRRAVTT